MALPETYEQRRRLCLSILKSEPGQRTSCFDFLSVLGQIGKSVEVAHSVHGLGHGSKWGGALVSAVDSSGRTARDLAEEKGSARAIKALNGEPSTGYVFEDRFILL